LHNSQNNGWANWVSLHLRGYTKRAKTATLNRLTVSTVCR